jgi:hypothetical protein
MGTPHDMATREMCGRHDDAIYQNTTNQARSLIYGKNAAISSDAVENLLKVTSIVPTQVGFQCISFEFFTYPKSHF